MAESSKDIELTVSLRNNLVKAKRKSLGLSQKQLDRKCGLPLQTVGNAERFRKISAESMKKLARFFSVTVEELFPPYLHEIKESTISKQIEFKQIKAIENFYNQEKGKLLLEYRDQIDSNNLLNLIDTVLDKRLAMIIKDRFGFNGPPQSRNEVADRLRISYERCSILEHRALYRLRRAGVTEALFDPDVLTDEQFDEGLEEWHLKNKYSINKPLTSKR